MNTKKFSEAMSELDNKYVDEAISYKRKRTKKATSNWTKWGAIAACVCLLCVGGFSLSHIFQNPSQDNNPPMQGETFVAISSLLAENNSTAFEAAAITATVPIDQYTGIYEKVTSAESSVLSQSFGKAVAEAETWYYVSGHTDMQYLIQNDNDEYSLWKFMCFDSEEYPYSDVLELVYQIDSADKISEIEVNPATMDNTDSGKAIQAQIGTHIVSDRAEIETLYQVISSLSCYGENRWDMIDYGSVEAAADEATSSNNAVWLGRYLTIVTSYGNEIDGLKYTAVSDMFYEYSGIAYNQLTEEQAASVCEILHIEKAVGNELVPENEKTTQPTQTEENEQTSTSEDDNAQPTKVEETSGTITGEAANAAITLEYITELQTKISTAMMNKELPFVTASAVYENPYRLHVTVSSNAEEDLAKLKAFDTIGGALEIEYNSSTPILEYN